MDVFFEVVCITAIVLAVAATGTTSRLRRRVERLEREYARARPVILEAGDLRDEISEQETFNDEEFVYEGDVFAPGVETYPVPTISAVTSAVWESTGVGDALGVLTPETVMPPADLSKPHIPPWLERARSTEEWEALIGGRWLNRIGALALILGMAFFLKYAIDNNWISEPLRVGMGLLVGLSLLGGARRAFRNTLTIFAQGLLGSGLAVLYLSLYAASDFYHLIPTPVALAAMGCVTALAFAQALHYDSLSVALLAWIGGFATVPLIGVSGTDAVGVIGYIVLLDAGILGIVARRDDWFILEPLAMGATYAIYFAWYASTYHPPMRVMALIALTLFWILFFALDVFRIWTGVRTEPALRHILGGANSTLFLAGTAMLIADRTPMGIFSLSLAAVYAATIWLSKRRPTVEALDARYVLTAIVFTILASPLLAAGFLLPILWSVEALALLWAGIRWNLWYVWWPAILVFGIASVSLLGMPGAIVYLPVAHFILLFNARAAAFLVMAGTLGVGSLQLRRLGNRKAATLVTSFQYAACTALFLLLAVETNDFFRRQMLGAGYLNHLYLEQLRSLVMAAVWIAFSLPLVVFGLRWRIFSLLSSGLAGAALGAAVGAGAGFEYQPIQRFTPILNDRVLVMCLLIAGTVIIPRILIRRRDAYLWIGTMVTGYQAVTLLLGFELISAEIHDFFRHATGALSDSGGAGLFVELMTLSIVWLLYSFPLVRYGVRNRSLSILLIGLGSLGAATGSGGVASLAFTPTDWLGLALSLRPLAVLALMAGLFLQSRFIRQAQNVYRWLDTVLLALRACSVLLGLELVSADTRDAFHHQIAAARTSDLAYLQNLERLSYSVVWLLYAIGLLMVGFWRRVRWMRLGAIALLGIVLIKVIGYDLSFLAPAYRSISFLGLGVVLLASSYLYQRFRERLLQRV